MNGNVTKQAHQHEVQMKVLIITYYWPPAGGPGVQRWLKFIKYLPQFGIEPIVYVPENPTYPLQDESLEDEVSSAITILKHPIFEPYRLASIFSKKDARTISSGMIPEPQKQSLIQRMLLYVRGNFFIPDARKYWVKPSVKYLKKYIEDNRIQTIITTGPPHSVHLIGMQLKEQLGIRWFADFRDPWTTIGYHKKLKLSKHAQKKHQILEDRVLHSADQLIVTSYTTRDEFAKLTSQPLVVITNGYDTQELPSVVRDSKFTIAHIGSLLSGRDPSNLWKALGDLCKENEDFAALLQLKLVGAVSDGVLQNMYAHGLEPYIVLTGYVAHDSALQIQRQAQVLALIEIDAEITKGIIPGKLFEYMHAERPILAIGPSGSDIQRILGETKTGTYFGYDAYETIKAQLKAYFVAFEQHNLEVHGVGVAAFSRENQTRQLATLLK